MTPDLERLYYVKLTKYFKKIPSRQWSHHDPWRVLDPFQRHLHP